MVTIMIRAIVITFFILFSTFTLAAVKADVDRTQVGEGESLMLTLSSEDSSSNKPDFSILEANFDVVGTSNSKNISIMNGQMSSEISWQIQLVPKQVGTIIIPAITIGNEKTQPITIEVSKQSSAPNSTSNTSGNSTAKADSNAFFQTTVDKNEAYVQEQIIYTQRFYYRPELPIADIEADDLSVEGASIEDLNTKGPRYEQTIDGVRYKVIEATYAIFPEKSGQLRMPARTVTVRMQASMFEPPRLVRLHSDESIVNVLPQPNHDNPWLPAKDLTIKQNWDTNPPAFKVGESITRKITIEAQGLSQSHLPAIPEIKIDGLKTYADKPETKNNIAGGGKGIVGVRTDSVAIVASKPGTYTLPAININWWDTNNHQQKTTTLDAFTFTVVENASSKNALPAPSITTSNSAITPTTNENKATIDKFWLFIAGTFLTLWILTLLLWWRAHKKTKHTDNKSDDIKKPETQKINSSPKSILGELTSACQNNDPAHAREALLQWSKTRWRETPPLSLEDLGQREPTLSDELRLLEQALYAKQTSHWQGDRLLKLVKQLPAVVNRTKTKKSPLESLYPPQ